MFKNIFGSSSEGSSPSKVNWHDLTKVSDLDALVAESTEKPVLIFKHSTRCSVSRMVLKQFENGFTAEDSITPYFLDLLNHRDVSNAIADRFGVYHQSPQLLVIKDGKAIFDASHESIDASDLKQFV
jgi:bacillithiol system protein YtxJ